MFELIKETLDKVSFFIKMFIILSLLFSGSTWRNNRGTTLSFNLFKKVSESYALSAIMGSIYIKERKVPQGFSITIKRPVFAVILCCLFFR